MLGRTAAVVTLSLALPWVIACSSRDSPDHIPGGASAGSSVSSSGANTTAATTGGGGDGSGPVPNEADLPVPYGTCPVFINGKNSVTIAGLPTRGVELRYTTASQAKNGPLVIIWHGEDETPKGALEELLGSKYVAKVLNDGGVVAVPERDPSTKGAVWFSSQGDYAIDDDFVVQDQLVACTRQQFGIDTRHIHVIGYQRGGFQATHAALVRSGYVASVVVHSGGVAGMPVEQRAGLSYPLMILHGGETLDVASENYGATSVALAKLSAQGAAPFTAEHFTVICDHGSGPAIATDALPATYTFLMDHPFGVAGSPYAQGLPSEFPPYCSIQQ